MKTFVGLSAKIYSYLEVGRSEDKKAKGTKKSAIRRKSKFENHKDRLETTQFEKKINHLEKNKIGRDCL